MNKLEQIIGSITNGQFTQAREEARRHGIKRTIDELATAHSNEPLQCLEYIRIINNFQGV